MLLQRQQSRAPSRMPQKYFESQEVLPPTLLLSQLSGTAKGIILFVYLTASLSRLNRLTRVSPTRKQTRGNKLKQTDRRSTARWGWAGPYRPSSSTPACAGCPPPQAAHGLGHRHRAPTAPASSAAASPPPGKQRAPHLAPKPPFQLQAHPLPRRTRYRSPHPLQPRPADTGPRRPRLRTSPGRLRGPALSPARNARPGPAGRQDAVAAAAGPGLHLHPQEGRGGGLLGGRLARAALRRWRSGPGADLADLQRLPRARAALQQRGLQHGARRRAGGRAERGVTPTAQVLQRGERARGDGAEEHRLERHLPTAGRGDHRGAGLRAAPLRAVPSRPGLPVPLWWRPVPAPSRPVPLTERAQRPGEDLSWKLLALIGGGAA